MTWPNSPIVHDYNQIIKIPLDQRKYKTTNFKCGRRRARVVSGWNKKQIKWELKFRLMARSPDCFCFCI